ncbi:hypothetical protein GCM10009037_17530 [Halarchaeum grantii]|uniref:Solute-binding protein family 5 domain-containing protein n=2 Tax=Halarchaeum grantii TaxID=1193105 RepID=A0A830FA22_9EURY|nr:hypothetical protein GCM10009037_17530 [Halarchaeum grantii]
MTRDTPSTVSLSVKTVPADTDPVATTIARRLVDRLSMGGIDADIVLQRESELYRDVLINHDFDVYVGRHPGRYDPDFLYSLLRSTFDGEPGWQNPFGFADLTVDDHLDAQRSTSGSTRRTHVSAVQREIASQQPFTPLAHPDTLGAARTDRFEGWHRFPVDSPLRYLALEASGAAADAGRTRLRVAMTDGRVTRNLNPLGVEYRSYGTILGLLYDPLARYVRGELVPWQARAWSWDGDTATLELRDGATWHDGKPLTADDVAFTYRFLTDTSLGNRESPVPAPRFRGRTSLVDRVVVDDDHTLRLSCGDASPAVAERAFTLPILPKHVWEDKCQPADIAGVLQFDGITKALVWPNRSPVGSGPLRVTDVTEGTSITLERFDDYAVTDVDGPLDPDVAFDELSVRVAPSDAAAVSLISEGDADATATPLIPSAVPRVEIDDALTLLSDRSRSFYHVGYNNRTSPLTNPRFRRVVAELLDTRALVDDVFDGHAVPTASPLSHEWVPDDPSWDDGDPRLSFYGPDGDFDGAAVREAFRDAGYAYTSEGVLTEQ